MRTYSQQEQINIVKDAMLLTAAIEMEEAELQEVSNMEFDPAPPEPVRQIASVKPVDLKITLPSSQENYLELPSLFVFLKGKVLKPALVWVVAIVVYFFFTASPLIYIISPIIDWIVLSLLMGFPVLYCIYLLIAFIRYNDDHKRMLNEKRAIEEEQLKRAYQQEEQRRQALAREAELKNKAEQQRLDLEFEKSRNHYFNTILPEYNERKKIWEKEKEDKQVLLRTNISFNKDVLKDLYDTSRLVSNSYRDLESLTWLYDDMSSSDHDIRYSTELYDRFRERRSSEENNANIQRLLSGLSESINKGFSDLYQGIDASNVLIEQLSQQGDALNDNARRIKNIVRTDFLISAYQRYLYNKA